MFDTIKKLRQILTRREKIQIGFLTIAIIIMALSQAIGVASILPFISLVMDPNLVFENHWLLLAYDYFNFSNVNRFIIFSGFVMFAIVIISNAISALATWFKLRFAWMNNHRLSRRLLEKYLAMPYAFFLNQNSSDLSKNILQEVNSLTRSFIIPLLTIITKTMITIFVLIMLFLINIYVSLFALFLLGGAYGAIFWRINKALKYRGTLRLKANQLRFKVVSEVFGGIKEVKVMNREPYFLDRYSKESLKQARLMSWNAVIGQIPRFAFEAIAFGSIIIFVLVLLITREDASQVIPIASLFAFAGYRLMPAIQEIFTSFTQIQFNIAVLDRIYKDFIRVEGGTLDDTNPALIETEKLSFKDYIELNNITYKYPSAAHSTISDINLTIKSNSTVAFFGPTGAGKTTLVDIILGLLPPEEGTLLVDGVVICQSNTIKWQRNIGYVPQHIYLSDDTVAANIAFGVNVKKIDLDALQRAARIANIHDFIVTELPKGYDTLVGERGIRLSGGQRQRIGIARALYHDPSLLVFDEATSALDGITEESVLAAIDNTSTFKTIIIIAHRIKTIRKCDMIYLIDEGRVTARGTYNELRLDNEMFKKMDNS